jgi:hypothetical protein
MGNNKTISISKTKKITVKRKNRVEKGKRAAAFGSNPHSKGEDFSRSLKEKYESEKVVITRRRGKINAIKIGESGRYIY